MEYAPAPKALSARMRKVYLHALQLGKVSTLSTLDSSVWSGRAGWGWDRGKGASEGEKEEGARGEGAGVRGAGVRGQG